jgi:hypothetical protein
MGLWLAPATLLLFLPPSGTGAENPSLKSFDAQRANATVMPMWPAVGKQGILSAVEFSDVWHAFFGDLPTDARCGSILATSGSDAELIKMDAFLVKERGFSGLLCDPQSWYIASARLDPCRVRAGAPNRDSAAVLSCAQKGKYSEIRFVLQPVGHHDRGVYFPDAALHLAFSIDPQGTLVPLWKNVLQSEAKETTLKFSALLDALKHDAKRNDASLFISGAGLERWTFARIQFENGRWRRDPLFHGSFYESISDADAVSGQTRTSLPEREAARDASEFLNPLKVHPLQGSCVGCHLAERGRPVRLFRQLGWGLQGEPVVSSRVRAEAELSAGELNLFSVPDSEGPRLRRPLLEKPAPSGPLKN